MDVFYQQILRLQSDIIVCEDSLRQGIAGGKLFDEVKGIFLQCKQLRQKLNLYLLNFLTVKGSYL